MDLNKSPPVVFKVSTWLPTDKPACPKSMPMGQVKVALPAEGVYPGCLVFSLVYSLTSSPSKMTE
jgi:hypothetical protein